MHLSTTVRARFAQIEFWVLTALFSIGILMFTWQALGDTTSYALNVARSKFEDQYIRFDIYKHHFIPYFIRYAVFFLFFMLLNFRWIPGLIDGKSKTGIIVAIILSLLIIWGINVSSDGYISAYKWMEVTYPNQAFAYFWQHNLIYTLWLAFACITYTLFKYGGLLLLSHFEAHPLKVPYLQLPNLQAWLLILLAGLLLLFFFTEPFIFLMWITILPVLIIFFNICYYRWIPFCLQLRKPKWQFTWRVLLWGTAVSLLIAFLLVGITHSEEIALSAGFLTWFLQVLMGAPAIWYWYHYQQKQQSNVNHLEQQLGQSTAQLDQLRTQINPHFLFNALNTVYALALTEQAEQTADAIEKISEMMRFMLRQNQEAFIPLEKDLDYLKNYISIQQMRLGTQSPLQLVTELPNNVPAHIRIAPMLLIPFVENAFKHGISMQAPSFMHLTIRLDGNKLTFSMQNSLHERIWPDDPEKHNHGIGMQNVKQRLALLYPDKHLLDIRQDDNSYTAELTVIL